MTVHFMCPACGGASIAVPAVCGQEAEARVYPVITGPMEADRPKHSRAGSLYEPKLMNRSQRPALPRSSSLRGPSSLRRKRAIREFRRLA